MAQRARQDAYKGESRIQATQGKERRRQQATTLRKQDRAHVLSMKRMRTDDIETVELSDEEAATKMSDILAALQQAGDGNPPLQQLRRLFARGSRFVDIFLRDDAAMPTLLMYLTKPATELEACWAFTNMAASVTEHTQQALNAAPHMIGFLASGNVLLQEQAAWGLGNMAADSPQARDTVLAQGIVHPIIALLESPEEPVVRQVAFCLSHLLRGPGAPVEALLADGLGPAILVALGNAQSPDVEAELYWCLTYITARRAALPFFVEQGIIPAMVTCLARCSEVEDYMTATPALRVLGNIVCGPDELTEMVLEAGALAVLSQLIICSRRNIKLETAWVLSSIAGGAPSFAAALVDAGFVPHLVAMLGTSFEMQREAAFALLNIGSHGPDTMAVLVRNDATSGIAILVEMDIVDILEAHQFSDHENVTRMSTDLLDKYFQGGEQDDIGPLDEGADSVAGQPPEGYSF